MKTQITDVPFDVAQDVGAIRYRIAAIDVGFDLRELDMQIAISRADDPIRISYACDGERRVVEGPQARVLRRLRKLGYQFRVE